METRINRYLFEIATKESNDTTCGFVDAEDEQAARAKLTEVFGEHQIVILDQSDPDRPTWGDDAIHYLAWDGLHYEIFERPNDWYLIRYNGRNYGVYESLNSAIWHAERLDVYTDEGDDIGVERRIDTDTDDQWNGIIALG